MQRLGVPPTAMPRYDPDRHSGLVCACTVQSRRCSVSVVFLQDKLCFVLLLFLMPLVVAMCCRPWPWRVVQHHPDSQRAWQSWGTVSSCSLVFSSLVLHFKRLATFSDNLLDESILKPHTCARAHTHTCRSADEVPT